MAFMVDISFVLPGGLGRSCIYISYYTSCSNTLQYIKFFHDNILLLYTGIKASYPF